MTGKLADTVMSVRNGEQIARKYQPVVFNPSTPAQVASRAKLKLASQLSAVMAPVIAIPRNGSVSARNLFVRKNYGAMAYSENQATVNLTAVQLTDSVVSFPEITFTKGETALSFYISGASVATPPDVSRVVYCLFRRESDGTLRYIGSQVATVAGETAAWSVNFSPVDGELICYAYGIRDNSDAARTRFGEMTVPSATMIATLIVTRVLTSSDVTLTETQSVLVPASENHSMSNGPSDGNRTEKKK